VGIEQWPEKINKIEEEANSAMLVADTYLGNHVQRLGMGKTIWRRKRVNSNPTPPLTLASEITNQFALRVLFTAKERAHSAPDVTWTCV
jgi:hypothetical protein